MGILPFWEVDSMHWPPLTCPAHTAGDVRIERYGAFTAVRCAARAHEERTPQESNQRQVPGRPTQF
jgi:hypothetical protein